MKPLAEATSSKVLAFDRPAFGLTSRVSAFGHSPSENGESKPLNPYSMAFAVLATLYFIDFLAAEKAIVVGYPFTSEDAIAESCPVCHRNCNCKACLCLDYQSEKVSFLFSCKAPEFWLVPLICFIHK